MIAEVIVDIESSETDKIFDYIIPNYLNVEIGARVVVPFGSRQIEGYIINIKPESILPKSKLKQILSLCDTYPVINAEMLKLMSFMIQQYNLKTVDALRLYLPSSMRQNKVRPIFKEYVFLVENMKLDEILKTLPSNATKQKELLTFFKTQKEEERTKLNKQFGSTVVNKFLILEVLQTRSVEVKRTPNILLPQNNVKTNFRLTQPQQNAIEQIINTQNKTFLLHGVTGSGKTEVYMQVISHYLKQNKTAIMLVPEISLTPQVLKNFRERFESVVAILHSGLSDGERYDEWRRIKEGQAKVVVGARSAIFAPIENLGVIIIDEEHDGSYYSESNPRYYTHIVAKFRANYNNANVVLGSATPKIETYYKVKQNEYILLELPERINNKEMPKLKIIDMKTELSLGNTSIFSKELKHELEKVVEQKNQAMIFINRRGYSSFLRCLDCGYVPHCTECDVSLVYHKHDNQLKCHFCNKRYNVLTKCPECGGDKIKQGAIGTQQIVDELKNVFPAVKILRMDNDTTTTKNAHAKILSEFASTRPSILVGTQMIAKGHDFPLVTLVGIVDADLSLHFSDYRATERTFELITQVAGRAGRQDKKGTIILQTYSPKHYVYRFSQNYDYLGFYEKEINLRKVTNFPPYSKIVRILLSGEQEEKTFSNLKEIYDKIKLLKEQFKDGFIYLEAMKSPVKRIKNKYRYQILMRLKNEYEKEILNEIFFIKSQLQKRDLTCFVEIDPQNLS